MNYVQTEHNSRGRGRPLTVHEIHTCSNRDAMIHFPHTSIFLGQGYDSGRYIICVSQTTTTNKNFGKILFNLVNKQVITKKTVSVGSNQVWRNVVQQ